MKLLRTQKVVYISCGEEHTAVLTKVRLGGRGCGGGETGSLTCRRVAMGGGLRGFDSAILLRFVSIVLEEQKEDCLLNICQCFPLG